MNLLLELGKLAIPVISEVVKNTITTKFEENVSQVAIKSLIAPAIDLVGSAAISMMSEASQVETRNNDITVQSQCNITNIPTVSETRQRILSNQFRYQV